MVKLFQGSKPLAIQTPTINCFKSNKNEKRATWKKKQFPYLILWFQSIQIKK